LRRRAEPGYRLTTVCLLFATYLPFQGPFRLL
jgi:hypothetical protein